MLAPFTVVNPSTLQNDFALTRSFRLSPAQALQVGWEVFNVLNKVNFNAPITRSRRRRPRAGRSTTTTRASTFVACRPRLPSRRTTAACICRMWLDRFGSALTTAASPVTSPRSMARNSRRTWGLSTSRCRRPPRFICRPTADAAAFNRISRSRLERSDGATQPLMVR